ncbi:MAG: hypothetical protein LBH90_06820 [Tannerella sp.]|jgi:hypothetical protein|nr:hypothetical protein [Tannerella sp.]
MYTRIKQWIIPVIMFACAGYAGAQEKTSFRLQNVPSVTQPVRKQFRQNDRLQLASRQKITGASVSGTVKFYGEQGLVRIVMEDWAGNEYLVYEASPMLAGNYEVNFEKTCEETALLSGIDSPELKVAVKDAEVYLNSVEMTESTAAGLPAASEFRKAKTAITEAQLKEKIDAINRYNLDNEVGWFAGETPLSKMSYAEKKKFFGADSDDFDTQGYEYYVSGFFTVKSGEKSSGITLRAAAVPLYLENFDWRTRYGVRWDTPIKNQGVTGLCVAFATVAATEIYTNLYFNTKVDLDLSEQQIASCRTNYVNNELGMGLSEGLLFMMNQSGLVNESAFPFVNTKGYVACISELLLQQRYL